MRTCSVGERTNAHVHAHTCTGAYMHIHTCTHTCTYNPRFVVVGSSLLNEKEWTHMDINNYMSPTEAAHRWNISKRTLENRFRASEAHLLEPHFTAGRIKRFRAPGAKQFTWIITRELMELWYGTEPTEK